MPGAPEIAVEVLVWRAAVAPDRLAVLARHLSPDERARADRFATPRLRMRFEAFRGRMRELLAARIEGAAPETLRFTLSEHGKPRLTSTGSPSFSLTHCGDLAALAITAAVPIGVDFETPRPIEPEVIDLTLSPEEKMRFSHLLSESARLRAFFRMWTRKEAFLKGVGCGFMRGPETVSVSFEDDAPARLLDVAWDPAGPRVWSLHDLALEQVEAAGALAVAAAGAPVSCAARWVEG